MNDTQPMAPTDAEIVALADATRTAEGGANGYILPISFARAALAKWGQPAQETKGRKVFVCTHCDGVYADQPVTRCDCLPDENTFTEGWICFGAPAQAAEPFGYFHQLLNHEGKGNGVWLGAAERKVVEQAHTPGETSEEIVALYTTPQPTHAQAGAVPLDEARRLFDAGWKAAALFCDREDVVADGIIGFGACPQFEAAFSAARGIKGGQHGTE